MIFLLQKYWKSEWRNLFTLFVKNQRVIFNIQFSMLNRAAFRFQVVILFLLEH
jgi:hypothetical protein